MDLASLVICGVENGTIGCQLAVLSVDLAFVMPHHPHFYPCGNACGIEYANEKLSKMVGNLATYPFNSWCIGRL